MVRLSVSVAVAVASTAFIYPRVALDVKSAAFLLTFGRFPRWDWISNECPSSVQLYNDPCMNQTSGKMKRYDAAHDAALTDRLLDAALKSKCPVVIERPFKDDACFERLQAVASNSSASVKVKMWERNRSEVNWWSDRTDREWAPAPKVMPLEEFLSTLMAGPAEEFTSFENSLVDSYSYVWGHNLTWIKGMASSNFLAHFPRTMISTPFHSALWDSLAYQCVGTKEWRFMAPHNSFQTVHIFGTGWTRHLDCNGRDDVDATITFSEVVGPDTLIYFPPWWAHSVRSEKGLNILLNYRRADIRGMFGQDFLRAAFNVLGSILAKTAYKGYDPPDVVKYLKHRKVPEDFISDSW